VRLKLTPEHLTGLSRTRSLNPAAYDAYLRGRYFVGQAKFAEGRADLERAVELDPAFAAGHAALAAVYERRLLLPHSEVSVAEAKAPALRALELDDHLAAAHAVLASILYGHEWDWKGAATHFRRALELDPNDPDANLQYCLYLRSLGRRDDSLAACKSAVELNPFDWNSNMALCSAYYNAHRTDDATRQCQRTVELSYTDSSRGRAQMRLALIDLDNGRHAQALTEASKSSRTWVRGYVNARAQRPAEALAVVEEMKRTADVPCVEFAAVYSALGRFDDAFLWLEKAYQRREYSLVDLREQRWWDPLRSDPRFADLIRRIGIPGP
jgi:tetratricopeptide (TPR) repeat protein